MKKQYIAPLVEIHVYEAENMLALSSFDQAASKDYNVLSREEEDIPTDFWGNEF